jgi:hypothetical protein
MLWAWGGKEGLSAPSSEEFLRFLFTSSSPSSNGIDSPALSELDIEMFSGPVLELSGCAAASEAEFGERGALAFKADLKVNFGRGAKEDRAFCSFSESAFTA